MIHHNTIKNIKSLNEEIKLSKDEQNAMHKSILLQTGIDWGRSGRL